MHLTTRNVNTAFNRLVEHFQLGSNIRRSPSRNGNVMVIEEPVVVTYTHPRERVLFNPARDANPFFHLFEALWMLCGRNDVEPVAYYASNMRNYSDDGKTFNGAYGERWRKWPLGERGTYDQLTKIAKHLNFDKHSRRAVLEMWDVERDLAKVGHVCPMCDGRKTTMRAIVDKEDPPCGICGATGRLGSKDVCCNLNAMFALRITPEHYGPMTEVIPEQRVLDMTVTNRSNDMIWGLLGANYVHFSFLQEYMAARVGAEVGTFHVVTNNLHAYDEPDNPKVAKWEPEKWLGASVQKQQPGHYGNGTPMPPFVKDPATFDKEVQVLVANAYGDPDRILMNLSAMPMEEPFLDDVARPAFQAFACHKLGHPIEALGFTDRIEAHDWRLACRAWLERRIKK